MKRSIGAVVVLLVLAAPACVETAGKRNADAAVGGACSNREVRLGLCPERAVRMRKEADGMRKAAEHGDANAQYNLGLMYDNGQGVTQDHTEAVRWYRKAERDRLWSRGLTIRLTDARGR